MGEELAKMVPLALAAAVNPTGIMVLIAVLATAKRTAVALAAGFCAAFIAFGVVVLALGLNITGGHGTASAVIDLAAAALILWLGVRSLRKKPQAADDGAQDHEKKRRLGVAGGFAAGLALAATDFTSIIPYGIALKDMSISGLDAASVAVLDAVFLVILLTPMVLPVALSYAAPNAADKVLKPVNHALTRHGDTIVGVVCIVLAAYLAGKGILGL